MHSNDGFYLDNYEWHYTPSTDFSNYALDQDINDLIGDQDEANDEQDDQEADEV